MTITLEAIGLPDDLLWSDEYLWSPVKQSMQLSLSGKPIIQEAAQVKGRPITLEGDQESAWVTKQTLEQLRALEATPNNDMTLDYHGSAFTVRFSRSDGNPIEARPIVGFANPQNDDVYSLRLKLFTV